MVFFLLVINWQASWLLWYLFVYVLFFFYRAKFIRQKRVPNWLIYYFWISERHFFKVLVFLYFCFSSGKAILAINKGLQRLVLWVGFTQFFFSCSIYVYIDFFFCSFSFYFTCSVFSILIPKLCYPHLDSAQFTFLCFSLFSFNDELFHHHFFFSGLYLINFLLSLFFSH